MLVRARPLEGCRHVRGKSEIATPAGVREFHNVKIWPLGDTLTVLLPNGDRVVFGPGLWSAAADTCATCNRELVITPGVAPKRATVAA